MSFDTTTTSIVIDNENSRIRYNGGGSTRTDNTPGAVSFYRNSAYVFDKAATATFTFTGPWVKVHGRSRFSDNGPTGSVKCTLSPASGTSYNGGTIIDVNGSSNDVLCGFSGLSASKSYTLTVSGTAGANIDYIEYGAYNPKDGDMIRFYPNNKNFAFINTSFARGFAVMGPNSGFNLTYPGASTIKAYAYRPDFDYPAVFNLSYDFDRSPRRFTIPSQTTGRYLPLDLKSSVVPQTGKHWVSLRPVNNDKPLFLDFVEVPYKSSAKSRALEARSLTIEDHIIGGAVPKFACDTAVQGILGLVLCAAVMYWLLLRRRSKIEVMDSKPQIGQVERGEVLSN